MRCFELKLSVMKVERHSKYLVYSTSSVSYGKSNVDLSSFAYNILNLQYLSETAKKHLYAIPKCLVEQNGCTAKAAVKMNGIYQLISTPFCRAHLPRPQKCFFVIRVAITMCSIHLPAVSVSRLTGRRFLGGGYRWCGQETRSLNSAEVGCLVQKEQHTFSLELPTEP